MSIVTARRVSAGLVVALLGGCAVGPHYAGPPKVAPRAETGAGFVRGSSGGTTSAPALAHWWEALADDTLNSLEARALAGNPDLDAARARVRQSRATFRQQRANRLPNANVSALYAHAHVPGLDLQGTDPSGGTSELNVYNLGSDASWEIDLFGGSQRAVEAARASAEVQQAKLADAQVSLTAEVAEAYLNIRERQQRIGLANAAIAKQVEMLALIQQRFEAGAASRLDVEQVSQQLDRTCADVAPVEAELIAYLDALATLTGDEPGAHDDLMRGGGPLPLPPATVAIGDPAALLRRRPDIRAAERTLAADTARIGQAEAARFPRLSIMGIVGIGGSRPSDLTDLGDYTALAAPRLSWSLFDFGRGAARVEQANAVRDESDAKYRAAVLAALRDAEDSLARFGNDRGTVAIRARALASADITVRLTRQRFDGGTTTLTDLLDAQRMRLLAEQSLTQAKSRMTLDFVALQKALGLGWSEPAGQTATVLDQPKTR